MKKKQRVSTVTPARPTIDRQGPEVGRLARLIASGLRRGGEPDCFSSQKHSSTATAMATTMLSFSGSA